MGKKIFKEIIGEKFLELIKDITFQLQGQFPSRIYERKSFSGMADVID